MASKAEATRERLLAATKTVVMSKGFAGMTIDDVLKAAGLTKGAFFHYFKSKADLADALNAGGRTGHAALRRRTGRLLIVTAVFAERLGQ